MAKVFLDTNYFIDAIHRKPERVILDSLENHTVCISPLSLHVYCYIFRIKVPNSKVIQQTDMFQIIEFTEDILESSLLGPTSDFEDNVELHSAAQAECDCFLTEDKKLLSMRFFGKTRILPDLKVGQM